MAKSPKKLFLRAWNSPSFTAWAAQINTAGSFLLLTPLLLRYFTPAELAVFYLLQSFNSIVQMVDFGFGPTFVRFLAYGRGGAG